MQFQSSYALPDFPDPLAPISADAVGKIHFALTQLGVHSASELDEACGYYANHGWSFETHGRLPTRPPGKSAPPTLCYYA